MWHTDFGITKEGEKAHRFLLTNNRGMCVELSDFGALYYQFMYLTGMEEIAMWYLVMII